jgi:hypothetical protein
MGKTRAYREKQKQSGNQKGVLWVQAQLAGKEGKVMEEVGNKNSLAGKNTGVKR